MKSKAVIKNIIFDLGGVLIDWNPRYLFRKIFADENEMEYFLENICTGDWNEEQDAGRSIREGTEWLIARHPEHEKNIRAYYDKWERMLGGDIPETVAVLKMLHESKKYKLYALTNWSAETFPVALTRFPFLHWFDGTVVSGEEKLRKPFPEFYKIILRRYNLNPAETLFIDDNLRNVDGARSCGIRTIHFQSAGQLKDELKDLEIVL